MTDIKTAEETRSIIIEHEIDAVPAALHSAALRPTPF